MPINTGSNPKLLQPGLETIWGINYTEVPKEWSRVFTTKKSKKAWEEVQQLTGFALFGVKSEGAPVAYDTSTQGFFARYNHAVWASGFVLTEENIDDNLYESLGEQYTEAMAFSGRQTEEQVAFNILNRAFNSSYTYLDGLELCSTVNLNFSGGTYQNELTTAADLSEASLEQSCIDIGNFTDDRGKQIAIMPDTLIIPVDLEFEAERILKSIQRPESANNDINALRSTGKFPGGVVVSHYLTDADAYFIKTNCPNGLTHFQRKAMTFGRDNDFDTGNMKFKAQFRGSWGCTDKRGIYGSPGV